MLRGEPPRLQQDLLRDADHRGVPRDGSYRDLRGGFPQHWTISSCARKHPDHVRYRGAYAAAGPALRDGGGMLTAGCG